MRTRRLKAPGAACVLLVAASGCAPRLAPLPTGPGTPAADARTRLAQAVEACRGVRTLIGVASLSGRAGGTRLRGSIEVGLAEPGRARLEAPGPFGSRPIFVFVARDAAATLLLPRDRRVLRHASPEAVVDALAGVSLGPDQLRTALSGCGLGSGPPGSGRSYGSDWLAVDEGNAVQWLRRSDDRWRLVASVAGALEVRYSDFAAGRPSTIRIRRGSDERTDLVLRLSQVDLNVPIEPAAFELEIPPDAQPMTLEELRRAGPLGEGLQ
ncbi:MAG TPA: hypothetical protein VD833_11735 [Vicinamibacterales bacterium]|nr:hypothetical protein [Vicinamibacterales bacterium]